MSELAVGQVWQKGKFKRKVVELIRNPSTGAISQVGWQRPDCDMKTTYVTIPSWKSWRNKASLDLLATCPY